MAASPVTAHQEHPATTAPTPVRATGWSLFWSGIGFALLFLLMGFVTYWFISTKLDKFVDADAKRADFRRKTLADRQTEDHKLLYDAPTWQDKSKGVVRVPIDRAMELTVAELQKTQPHPAYPLTQSPPQPAAAPTSPDKGGGTSAPGNNAVNPPASNPTVGQPSPAPVAPAPTAAPATSTSSPAPAASPATTAAPTPATTGAPAPTPAAPATPAPATPAPATPTPAPAATPVTTTPATATNNANNPGNPPVPGTSVQPPAPTATATPTAAIDPTPAPTVAPTPAPASTGDSTPSPTGPGTSPTGTP